MSTHKPARTGCGDAEPHANYPHTAGYLFDCAACEARCHCVAGREAAGHMPCVFEAEHVA
jgi:hypothetical protein